MVAMAHTNLRWKKSDKLADVLYDIRGPVLAEAQRLEDEGHHILKLNIGNPSVYGFEAPEAIVRDVLTAIPDSHGYSESRGIISARRAVVGGGQMPDLPQGENTRPVPAVVRLRPRSPQGHLPGLPPGRVG